MREAGFTTFLVDDDPAVLKSITRLLNAAGYKTKSFSSPQEFLSSHDPSIPGCAIIDLVMSELDGLHLDYIRHPGVLPHVPGSRFGVGLDFGYGPSSRERFRSETGLAGPYRKPESPQTSPLVYTRQWDDWRRAQVSTLVSEIRAALLAEHLDLLISAAVIAYADRAYLTLAQDWRGWLADGLVDFAVPMVYTLDDRLLRYHVEALAAGPNADRIWVGIGAWLFASDPKRAVAQLEIVRAAGSVGETLFSYDALADSPALLEALIAAQGSAP